MYASIYILSAETQNWKQHILVYTYIRSAIYMLFTDSYAFL